MHPTLAFDSPDGQPVATTISWAPPGPVLASWPPPATLGLPTLPTAELYPGETDRPLGERNRCFEHH